MKPQQPSVQSSRVPVAPSRTRQGGTPTEGYALVLGLAADERFRRLRKAESDALLHAALFYADGRGVWWHSREAWAKGGGFTLATIKRAISAGKKCGLLQVWPIRNSEGKQTSNSYRLDPSVMAAGKAELQRRLDRRYERRREQREGVSW